jgi:uncharacterized protein
VALTQFQLGEFYAEGLGVLQNRKTALLLYEISAKGGFAPAQYEYGLALYNGDGIDKNPKEGLMWLQKASRQGHEKARKFLASIVFE